MSKTINFPSLLNSKVVFWREQDDCGRGANFNVLVCTDDTEINLINQHCFPLVPQLSPGSHHYLLSALAQKEICTAKGKLPSWVCMHMGAQMHVYKESDHSMMKLGPGAQNLCKGRVPRPAGDQG